MERFPTNEHEIRFENFGANIDWLLEIDTWVKLVAPKAASKETMGLAIDYNDELPSSAQQCLDISNQ